MKTSGIATAAAILAQSHQIQAGPIDLVARVNIGGVADALTAFLGLAKNFFPDADELWDYREHNQMCSVRMETKDGGNCKVFVTCDDGEKKYNDWNVCYVGGRQYFNDPGIGDFSVTFAEKDGRGQGEGLTTPVLQVKYIDDWREIPVDGLAVQYQKHKDCDDGGFGNSPFRDCGDGPYVCHYGNMGNKYIEQARTKKWECGIPKVGKSGGQFDSNQPENDNGFAPSWCGVHVIQYQKPDPSKDDYSLEVTNVNDANENKIGYFEKGGPTASVTSKLPLTLEIKTGGVDADPVSFSYGDQSWDSNDGSRCSVGKYDSGKRQMDCGFSC